MPRQSALESFQTFFNHLGATFWPSFSLYPWPFHMPLSPTSSSINPLARFNFLAMSVQADMQTKITFPWTEFQFLWPNLVSLSPNGSNFQGSLKSLEWTWRNSKTEGRGGGKGSLMWKHIQDLLSFMLNKHHKVIQYLWKEKNSTFKEDRASEKFNYSLRSLPWMEMFTWQLRWRVFYGVASFLPQRC